MNLSPITRHHPNRVQPPNLTNNPSLQSMADFWDQASNLHSPMTPNGSDKVVSPSHELSGSQPHTPLTPPLTPASSSNDNLDGSNSASSNSSLLYSPAATCWPQAQLHSHIQFNAKETGPIRPSFDSDMQMNSADIAAEFSSNRNFDVARDLQLDAGDASGRFLLVTGVPKDITSERLMNEFKECGDIRGIFTRFREQQGAIILAFYDCRQMPHAKQCLDSQTFFGNTKLSAQFVRSSVLKKIVGNSSFMVQATGELYITIEGGIMSPTYLRNVLLSFGALRNFQQVESEDGLKQTFVAEYSDSRDGQCAMNSLDSRTMLGNRIRVIYRYRDDSMPGPVCTQQLSEDSSRGLFHLAIDTPQSYAHAAAGLQSLSSEKHEEHDAEVEQIEDMTNSSPFTHRRPLPPLQTSPSSAVSASSLHHSTSEQDLRRRAASAVVSGDANAVGGKDAALARRTSITFGQDAHRHAQACANAAASIKSNQNRPRSISESSASSPSAQVAVKQPSVYSSENTSDSPRQANVVSSSQSPRDAQHNNYGMTSSLGLTLPQTPQSSTLNTTLQRQSFITSPGLSNRQNQGDPQTPNNMYYHSQIYWPNHSSPLSPMSTISASPMMPLSVGDFVSQSPQNFGIPFPANEEYTFYHPNRSIPSGLAPPPGIVADVTHTTSHSINTMSPRSPLSPSNPRTGTGRRAPMSPGGRSAPDSNADKGGNGLDLDRIAQGLDTRTTVMVKNIPNKLNDRELVEYIGKVKPNRIDFLYLRMDFQNGCNVGYAFVNFITVQDLLRFARARLGIKWNMFSSEKVLQMSYATYQGKEALVEKFKNSCVMDERESWRPKIFYSSGPLQGQPEPFPAPTHLRRKERSSQNRGALFVPGPVHAGAPGFSPGYPTLVTANGSGLTMTTGLPSPGPILVGNSTVVPMIAGPGLHDENAGSHTPFRRTSHPHLHPLQSSSYSPSHHRTIRLENR